MKTLNIDLEKLAAQYGIDELWGADIVTVEGGRVVLRLRGEFKNGR